MYQEIIDEIINTNNCRTRAERTNTRTKKYCPACPAARTPPTLTMSEGEEPRGDNRTERGRTSEECTPFAPEPPNSNELGDQRVRRTKLTSQKISKNRHMSFRKGGVTQKKFPLCVKIKYFEREHQCSSNDTLIL